MKKALIAILALTLLLFLVACGGDKPAEVDTPETEASTEFTPIAGTWIEDGEAGGTLLINVDGTFEFTIGDTFTKGTVKLEKEEYPDGTTSPRFSLYEDNGDFFLGFIVGEGTQPTELYSGQDGARHFVLESVG